MLFLCTDEGASNSEQVKTREIGVWCCPPPGSTEFRFVPTTSEYEATDADIRNRPAASSGLSKCLVELRRYVPANRRTESSFRSQRIVLFSSNRSPFEVVSSCSI